MLSNLLPPRSALFVPGTRPELFTKALASGADAVILDLEDAIAASEKDQARENAVRIVATAGDTVIRIVRVNSPRTPEGKADLEVARSLGVDALMVPKAEPETVAEVARLGLPLIALIETAVGVLKAAQTARADGVAMLMIGPIDLGAELGLSESDDGDELLVARGQITLAAAAAGLPGPLDGPCAAIRDQVSLRLQIERAKRLGFSGKACIHPAQVEAVNRGFSPSESELEFAHAIVNAASAGDGGVAVLDGRMVDRPVELRARRILASAERRREP